MSEQNKFPWKNGHYKTIAGRAVSFMEVSDDIATIQLGPATFKFKLESGTYHHPDKRGLEITGSQHYNVELVAVITDQSLPISLEPKSFGIVSEDGSKIINMNGTTSEWIDEESFQHFKTETDPADNLPNNYTPKPNHPERIVWISGGTGVGKSTTSLYFKDNFDYVLYEGDAFMLNCNPYVGAAPEGTSLWGTKELHGVSVERNEICQKVFVEAYPKLIEGKYTDPTLWKTFYSMMCDDIIHERNKLGGNWVISQGVYPRAARDVIRNKLGPELRFIQLGMEPELQTKRVAKRLATGFGEVKLSGEVTEEAIQKSMERMQKMVGNMDPVQQDEPNTLELDVKEDMSVKVVAERIIEFAR